MFSTGWRHISKKQKNRAVYFSVGITWPVPFCLYWGPAMWINWGEKKKRKSQKIKMKGSVTSSSHDDSLSILSPCRIHALLCPHPCSTGFNWDLLHVAIAYYKHGRLPCLWLGELRVASALGWTAVLEWPSQRKELALVLNLQLSTA